MKTKFQIGHKVITLIDKEPYYSNYGGNPKIIIPKGTIGYVGAVNVPVVHNIGKGLHFNCVDFEIEGKTWRGSYYDKEIKLSI
jgi:hypothetical protein